MENNLAIVIPAYNEETVIQETITQLIILMKDLIQKNKISQNSFMFFVDDGSKDKTWSILPQ